MKNDDETVKAIHNCTKILQELTAKLKQATRFYNQGYMAGHEDTVEAVFTPLVDADMETYHSDVVEEIMKEMEENP